MIVEVTDGISFSFIEKPKGSKGIHELTIWIETGGYIEVQMNDKELEDLRNAIQ